MEKIIKAKSHLLTMQNSRDAIIVHTSIYLQSFGLLSGDGLETPSAGSTV